jgi:hypothetical protein
MKNSLSALKSASRRAKSMQYPFLSGYSLSNEELQRLIDGKSTSYEVVVCQGQRALKHLKYIDNQFD